jgi:sacsin
LFTLWSFRFKELSHNRSTGTKLPFASVAAAISGRCMAVPVSGGGRLFHSLPLPIKTGLPVHINAAFNVSSNRRSICDEDDDKGVWNRALFSNLVRCCYAQLLERAAEKLKHASVHLLLPAGAGEPWTNHVQV